LKSDGNQFFSYTYTADVVRALLFILLHGVTGTAYNVSNPSCNVRLKDFAEACAQWAGRQVVYDIPSATEQKGYSVATYAILDNSRLHAAGFTPLYSFADSIRRTLDMLSGH
jgi:nucleoside-diphosphate-sugar epimerase